jgi:hypothetical protein
MDDGTIRPEETELALGDRLKTASRPFVGRWNRLVSTTNWQKGRIICDWRESLQSRGAAPREYTDEAWSRLVGCVTAQHVGRLRRVYQRFGASYREYKGLYWSHFQAAIDWDDAEMYLEGAVQSGWSVSQMRRTRWEAMGAVESQRPHDEDIVVAELDEDFEPAENVSPESDTITAKFGEVTDPRPSDDAGSADEEGASSADRLEEVAAHVEEKGTGTVEAVRPFENLPELPEDVADAFDQMKIVILRHKADGWREITREEMLGALDALKELALAPSVDGAPR